MRQLIISICLCFTALSLQAQLTFFTLPGAAGASGQAAAGSLNDTWELVQQSTYCGSYAFLPVFGIMTDDCAGGAPVGPGSITGLVLSDNIPYAGTVSFQERLVFEDESDLATAGIAYTSACGLTGGVRDDSNNTLQGDAPSPDTEGMIDSDMDGNLDYYNGYAGPPSNKKTGILLTFSQPITAFSLFLGDVESRSDGLDGYPGKIVLYNGGSIVNQSDIPTGTPNQSLCDGDNNASYDGCGNDETVFVHYTGAAITDVLILVGEVISDAGTNNNKASFAGLSLGGVCLVVAPVELTRFEARREDKSVALVWETASELDNAFFSIEHSNDGQYFREIGRVAGGGTSSDPQFYSFMHRPTEGGDHYFRLRQVDFDGSEHYSHVEVASFPKEHSFQVYPNPVDQNVWVSWDPIAGEQGTVRLFNALGAKLMEWEASPGTQLDLAQLPAGTYFVQLQLAGLQEMRLVQKR